MVERPHERPFRRGVESFNRGAYFDAHDRWEECWIGSGRPSSGFFKGLVQAAVAMHHLSRGNLPGAEKLTDSAAPHLLGEGSHAYGIDAARFADQLTACVAEARRHEGSFDGREFCRRRAPKIELREQHDPDETTSAETPSRGNPIG